MQLWMQRGMSGGVYSLRVVLETDAVEDAIIAAHAMATMEVWLSPTAMALEGAAERAMAASDKACGWSWSEMWQGIGAHRVALGLFREAAQEARLTVGDLVAGATLESSEVSELLAVEAGLRVALEPVMAKVEALASYEDGGEMLAELPTTATGIAATDWFQLRRR